MVHKSLVPIWTGTLIAGLLLGSGPSPSRGQDSDILFPPRSLFPKLLAGSRDPALSFSVLGVTENPNAHGSGVEVEVSIGTILPVFKIHENPGGARVLAGIEAGVFARFGLQVVERELIATDWVFAVPVIWYRRSGWFRFRYYHSSSHLGDEYARRFEEPGINFSRDAAEVLYFHAFSNHLGAYGGARYAYNVHPEESERWVMRTGAQLELLREEGGPKPFFATDVEWDQDAGTRPRLEARAGLGLEGVGILRGLRVSLSFLTGPTPLGQFNGKETTQIGLTIEKNL